MFHLGLVSISFRKHTPKEIITEVVKTPLTCIEWGSDVHAPCTNIDRIKEIVQMQQDMGITCCSYGTYFRVGVNKPEEVVQYIEPAKILGTDTIRLWCGNRHPEDYSAAELSAVYDDCYTLAEIAKRNGVKFCMECHDWTLTESKESSLALMKAVAHPNFRMYWQPNQWISEKDNIAFAKAISVYTENIHVFNWKGREKYPMEKARDIWKRYLECFSEDKTLLLEHMYDERLESLAAEAKTLQQICLDLYTEDGL